MFVCINILNQFFVQVAMLDFLVGLRHNNTIPANSALLAQRLLWLYRPAAFAVSGVCAVSSRLLL